MDAVNAFNVELFSMNDMMPPISRAKMMSVTKAAIKAIKLYKHVVQIVERFIRKCKPELKVSGLYVVDSIIRQSRHQFGLDKDVFGPRFLKNFTDTFQNLYLCPEDDKSKVVRVLNLWQKNGVFDMDILQPLMDMANRVVVPPPAVKVPTAPQPETALPVTTASVVPVEPQLPNFDALAAVAQLFQSPHGHELQRILQNLQQANKTLSAADSDNIPNSPQMHVAQLNPYSAQPERKSSFAEKLLDRFDYDDEPEVVTAKEGNVQPQGIPENVFPRQVTNMENVHMMAQTVGIEQLGGMSHGEPQMLDRYHPINEASLQFQRSAREDSTVNCEGRHGIYSRRSRSDSRSPRRRRSRSLSRTRRYRHQRSRSGERHWRSRSRSRSRDRNERQKDRDRRQKGLPSKKSHTLSVCSTTLWIGQLDKKTQQCDVMCLLEEFGQIESINMIPPRGCAYIAMVHRQDAYTALNKLSSGPYRVNQKPVKIAWALNRGIKTAHKKFWDVEQGVTYIPWSKVKIEDLESYREGGMLDEETLNPEWNVKDLSKQAVANGKLEIVPVDGAAPAHIQAPHEQTLPIGSPLPFSGPVVLSPTSMPPGGAPYIHAENMHTKAAGIESPPEDANMDSEVHLSHSTFSDNHLRPLAPPVITLPEPGVFRGPRPGFPPLHPRAGMTNPHIPQFPPSPNMPHLHPQVPRGPMFTHDRFRMPLPFPPRDPPFHRYPSTGLEDMDGIERRHFQNRNPEFARPPFQRGRW